MGDRHVSGEALSSFLDDELDDDRALEIAHHAAACDACRSDLDELRVTREALRRLPDLQAPVLAGAVRARSRWWSAVARRLRWAAVTVVAVAALAGAAYVAGDDGDVIPPVELFLVDHVARTGGGPVPAPVGTPGR